MVAAARRLGDRHLEGGALALRGYFEYRHHELDAAERSLDAALALAGEGHDDVRLAVTAYRVHVRSVAGRLGELPELLREADRLTGRGLDPFAEHMLLVRRGGLAHWAGRYGEALDLLTPLRRAAEAARQEVGRIQIALPEVALPDQPGRVPAGPYPSARRAGHVRAHRGEGLVRPPPQRGRLAARGAAGRPGGDGLEPAQPGRRRPTPSARATRASIWATTCWRWASRTQRRSSSGSSSGSCVTPAPRTR